MYILLYCIYLLIYGDYIFILLTILSSTSGDIVMKSLEKDGIIVLNCCSIEKVSMGEKGETKGISHGTIKLLVKVHGGEESVYEVDELLVAAGRAANVENMGLESAGIEYDRLVKINSYLQTTNPNVYAVGDCCSQYQFTHCADFM